MWKPIADPVMSRWCWNAIEAIERSLLELGQTDPDPQLSTGNSGLALFFAYLDAARQGSDASEHALNALYRRLPRPDAGELLGHVLDSLAATAEESEVGLTWHTPPEWLPSWHREQMPEGCHNLGVSHGMPGVIGFLAAARHAGVQDPRLRRLAEGAVRWLLDQKLPPGEPSVFPSMIIPAQAREPSRVAWCYGDLGISVILLSAARSFNRPDWEEEALALARLVARRPEESTAAVDSCLCHGTAGNGHLFNRLYQATGDPEMKETALAWYRRALDTRRPGEGFAGFLTWVASPPEPGEWAGRPGFPIGGAGVGLALLAAVSHVEPLWDRVLLTSIPPIAPALPTGTSRDDRSEL